MQTRIVALLLALALAPAPTLGDAPVDCRAPGADCTLKEAAAQAGIGIGAIREGGPPADTILASEFGSLTVTSYWATVHPDPGVYTFEIPDATLAFAEAHSMVTRGHTLIWDQESLDAMPAWVTEMTDPNALRALLREHVATVVGRYRGRIGAWDVVNEPIETLGSELYENVFLRLLGREYIAEAFRTAHASDPNANLFLNEILIGLGPLGDAKLEAFLELVRDLLADGVPIHGIGFQGHFFAPLDAAKLHGALRAFEELGLVAELTEVDVPQREVEDKDTLQRQEYFELVSACLSVSACQRITIWGVSDAYSWLNWFIGPGLKPLPFDDDFARKPAYEGVREALLAYVPRDLSGERMVVRDHALKPERRALTVVSEDAGLVAAGPVPFGDPTQLGGSLRLLNPITSIEASIDLPAAGWKALGDPPTGYRFRDPDEGPCRKVVVRPGKKLRVRCRGAGIDFRLDEPSQSALAVEIRIGDAPLQCFEFGGAILCDQGSGSAGAGCFRARRASASSRCALP